MKNVTALLSALMAAVLLAGCQPKADPNVTINAEPGSSVSTKPTDVKPGEEPATLALDSSGVMYAASYQEAVDQAKKEGKLVMVKFTADWCGPCHEMSDAMKKVDLSKQLANVVPVQVDIDKEVDGPAVKNFMAKNGGIPYIVLINKEGKEVANYQGFTTMDSFSAWLSEKAKA